MALDRPIRRTNLAFEDPPETRRVYRAEIVLSTIRSARSSFQRDHSNLICKQNTTDDYSTRETFDWQSEAKQKIGDIDSRNIHWCVDKIRLNIDSGKVKASSREIPLERRIFRLKHERNGDFPSHHNSRSCSSICWSTSSYNIRQIDSPVTWLFKWPWRMR